METRVLQKSISKFNNKDLSIFKNEYTVCTDSDYSQCAAINRLDVALKYFSVLDVKNDSDHQNIFIAFIEEVHHQILDDNNHLMLCHNDKLQEISDHIIGKEECAMNGCAATQRHFETETKTTSDEDELINFYVSLFDSLHFWIYHCFDGGYRVKPNEQKEQLQEKEDEENKTLFDAEFARLNTQIRTTDFLTQPFERISPSNNSKYSICAQSEQQNITFLDAMYGHLEEECIDTQIIQKLQALIERELYESDTIKIDFSHVDYQIIANNVNNKECKQSILRFIKATKVMATTFSLGLRFYYWPYYKDKDELPANEQMIGSTDNKHDHFGYKVCDLYVDKKYDSFKEEIANYSNFGIAQYKEAKIKTEKFMKTKEIKKTKAKGTYYLRYEIAAALIFEHILSLILYTDYTKLSTDFSSSFRKLSTFETLKSIKQRNALYFWMSKFLRELVECFGQCSNGDYDVEKGKRIKMRGPYFCGMNMRLNIPSFAMRLNSPSSTSKQISVAIKFSGPKGVVLTFDNPSGEYAIQYEYLRGWDCSWIGRFGKEEDERLFFGGYYRIKVVNLRLIETNENMKQFVSAIFHFDLLLTGSHQSKSNKNDFFIIQALLNQSLKKQTNVTLPSFICDCFQAFTQNKKQIIFELYYLNEYGDKRINDLLFYSLDKRWYSEEIKRKDDDQSNLVRTKFLSLFPNCKTLIIQSTREDGYSSFSFSLMALLNVISQCNLDEIIIKSKEYYDGDNWIKSWSSDDQTLKKEYAAKGYVIEMEDQNTEFCLKIIKMSE